jgi:hypothetical protein
LEFYGTGTTEHHLKGLSYEIDFKNVDENLQVLALKVHKIEIFFGFDFEICIVSLLVMSKF